MTSRLPTSRSANTPLPPTYTLFGIVDGGLEAPSMRLREALGIRPDWHGYPDGRSLFFSSRGDDLTCDEDALAMTLGFVRTPDGSKISATDLAGGGWTRPAGIRHEALTGNGIVGRVDRREPRLGFFATPTATVTLFCADWFDGVVFSTELGTLVRLLSAVEPDEQAAASHFLMASTLGNRTYFRGVQRLSGGYLLTWSPQAGLDLSFVRGLDFEDECQLDQVSVAATDRFFEEALAIMGSYIEATRGGPPAVSLSGGVDSSLLQLLVKGCLPVSEAPRSFSYRVAAPSFAFEVEYARQASRLLETRHHFCDFEPDDFPNLLVRTVRDLVQPTVSGEVTPAMLAQADAIGAGGSIPSCIFFGESADALLGTSFTRKLLLRDWFRAVPGSAMLFSTVGRLLGPIAPTRGHGLAAVGKLLAGEKGGSRFFLPTHGVEMVDLQQARRCFGDRPLLDLLDERYALARTYLDTSSELEMVHLLDLIFPARTNASTQVSLYARQGLTMVPFYLDLEIVRLARRFHPSVRFNHGTLVKPIPKLVLEQRGLGSIARKKKGKSVFIREAHQWMAKGPLKDRLRAVERPTFLSAKDFERHLAAPGQFAWSLLTWDIFQQEVVGRLPSTGESGF